MPVQAVDTHDLAIQASAYRILKLLYAVYPEMIEANQLLVVAAQGSLLGHLNSLISGQEPAALPQEVTQNAIIGSTIMMINHINSVPEALLSSADKIFVFKQMITIASTCPGIIWDAIHEQWSTNQFYTKQGIQQLMTPPAEALNLVCRALLDDTRYEPNLEHPSQDKTFRIEMFYTHLLDLERQKNKGSLDKCAAGLQHDLLFMLQDKYLDESRNPIHFPMIIADLMLESLSLFIKTQLNEKQLFQWALWQVNEENAGVLSPLILQLRANNPSLSANPDELWQELCKSYVTARLEFFGIDPLRAHFDESLAAIESVPIPTSENSTISLVVAIITMKDLPVLNFMPGAAYTPMVQLVMFRNDALLYFKWDIDHINIDSPKHQSRVRDFLTALDCVSMLNRHRDEILLLFGAGDSDFISARFSIINLLAYFFSGYAIGEELSWEYTPLRSRYRRCEREFLKSSHMNWISNFFASTVDNQPMWEIAWAQLQALSSSASSSHPLILNDASLLAWHAESQRVSDEGQAVFDVDPYAANRLLLHGFLVPVKEWTPLYCRYLIMLTSWLAASSPGQEDVALTTFKKSYPRNLLANMCFRALICHSALSSELKHMCLKETLSITDITYRALLFFDALICVPLKHLEFSQIWEISQDYHQIIIPKGGPAMDLFNIHPEWMGMHNLGNLRRLLQICPTVISEAWRIKILKALAPRLATIIKNSYELASLFDLASYTRFSEACRQEIFAAPEFQRIIQDGAQLYHFFSLDPHDLSIRRRFQILTALAPTLAAKIKDGAQLANIFRLPLEALSERCRLVIWEAVAPEIGMKIKDGYQLANLLDLPVENFNEDSRLVLFDAVASRFETIIKDGDQLVNVLKLSPQQLNEERRLEIFVALAPDLRMKIQNVSQLANLMAFPPKQLNEACRLMIMNAVTPVWLKTIIQDRYQLAELLFKIASEPFNDMFRAHILAALPLETMIQSGCDLEGLFLLPSECLNEVCRSQILSALKLDKVIEDEEQLDMLFQLPPDLLNETHRAQILESVKIKPWFLQTRLSASPRLSFFGGANAFEDSQQNTTLPKKP